MKTYSELMSLPTVWDRYRYLRIGGKVGKETFGADRYLNQIFYQSDIWKAFRRDMILRDKGCDLAAPGFEVFTHIFVHHITPITLQDVLERREEVLLNPENAICCSFKMHQAIHYAADSLVPYFELIERVPGDTCPWKGGLGNAAQYGTGSYGLLYGARA